MMIRVVLSLFLFNWSLGFAQTGVNGDSYFENFEYEHAARSFEKSGITGSSDLKSQEKLAYCYFVLNDSERGLPLVDQLIRSGSSETELWYWKAFFERDKELYSEAVASALKYLELGGKNLPLKFRESCYMLQNTPEYIEGNAIVYDGSDSRSDHVSFQGDKLVFFYEVGVDSTGTELGLVSQHSDQAELLLSRPFVKENNSLTEWKIVSPPGIYLSVNSLEHDPGTGQVFFGAAEPGSNSEVGVLSQIYEAKTSGFGGAITDYKPWKYSGIEDTSYCGQISLNSTGSRMVFAKQKKGSDNSDLYYSDLINDDWTTPAPVPGVNTLGNEMFPQFLGDTALSFSSDGYIGYGGLDVFYIQLKNWGNQIEPKRLPLPLNSKGDDFLVHYISADSIWINSNRSSGIGEDDIWIYSKPKPIIPEPEPEPEILPPPPPPFDVEAFLRDCNSKKIYFQFKNGSTEEQFDFVPKLKELVDQGYVFNIQVTGYADARGTKDVNYKVGMDRANSVRNTLSEKGIPKEWMKSVSMGSSKIENRCRTQWIECSEEEHKLNRYVQLTITLVK